jgi:hypothetical protein
MLNLRGDAVEFDDADVTDDEIVARFDLDEVSARGCASG